MEQKQELIGGILAKKGLELIVGKALEQVAKRPWNGLKPEEVKDATKIAVREMEPEINSHINHATNNEPFYKSRVTLGALMGVLGAVVGIYQLATDGLPEDWNQWSPHVMVLGGAVFTIYGRFVARKPLGE